MGDPDKPDEKLGRGGKDLGPLGERDLVVSPNRQELDERGGPYAYAPPAGPSTTQVADGLPLRAWTVDEVERMLDAGILCASDPFELIGGELVAMASKDRRHEVLRTELLLYWARRMGSDLKIASQTPLRLGQHDAPEPDLIVFPGGKLAPDVRGDTALLVVEIANSSLPKDLTLKAPRYAAAGVPEYWVVIARTLVTTVHRDPQPNGGYAHRTEHAATETHAPVLTPSLAVRIADLGLE